jgi:1-phosphatidylinositol-3-phosphate 5-kinase
MENLLCNQEPIKTYDLKGALRGRYVLDPNAVLLDGNRARTMQTSPLCVQELAKQRLWVTVANDTKFLALSELMDYSVLVGVDAEHSRIICGIIDYIRAYTWDKQVETLIKTRAYNVKPTVISPDEYRARFRSALWNYFVLIPDHHTGVPPPSLPIP